MVVLPYKDRLELFSRYLQQLVMESLGKELNLNRDVVNQGITVFGNKGSTDQHAYVQQLRDGPNDFFVTFIEVLDDGQSSEFMVENDATAGDFLHGFYLGTRQALAEKDRESLTITVNEVSVRSVGKLIALFERAVGFYASFIGINAYHQPGVEAGKKAAGKVVEIQRKILNCFSNNPNKLFTINEISQHIHCKDDIETIHKVIQHLTANKNRRVLKAQGHSFLDSKYRLS